MILSRITHYLLALSLTWFAGVALAVNPSDLLPPEQAFSLRTSVVDAKTLRTQWDIADGYYMYRKRFTFTTDTPGITLGAPSFPQGKMRTDEFFGAVEIYRGRIRIDIPIRQGAQAPASFRLTSVSQGCADLGVCYPPLTQTVTLNLPSLDVSAPLTSEMPGNSPGNSVKDFFNNFSSRVGAGLGLSDSGNKFLEPDQAYRTSIKVTDGNTLTAHWDIADGYYMYRDKFSFRLIDAAGVSLAAAQLPRGEVKVDEAFGKTEVFHQDVSITLPLLRSAPAAAAAIMLEAKYQGCAEAGFCYPPMTKTVSLRLPAVLASANSNPNAGASVTASDAELPEQDRIARALASEHLGLTLLTFFGFGLLLAFTPCVFPMIPILSSIIASGGAGQSTRRAFTLSLVFVLAEALTYAVLGILAGQFGQNLQAAAQNPWVLITFSGIFVLLALSMFGLYQLQLPSRWQSGLAAASNRQRGGHLLGVAVMGFLSALIVGPCVAAPLAGALIYIGQTGDAVLGGLALFALGLGMGAPLLLIGTTLGSWLPRAGTWMNAIKAVFGVLLLAVAIWLLERVIPPALSLLLWALLLIISAVFMGALEKLKHGDSGWRTLWKGIGVASLLYGGLLLIGALSGGSDVLRPLEGLATISSGKPANHRALPFKQVKGLDALNQQLAAAEAQGKPVMFDLYADWCVSCKEMEKYTFSDPAVQRALSGALLVQADVTLNDAEDQALLRHLKLIGPPAILFFDASGKERKNFRLVGFLNAEEFLDKIRRAIPAAPDI